MTSERKRKGKSRVEMGWMIAALLAGPGFLASCGHSGKAAADNAAAPRVAVVKAARHNISSTLEIDSEFQPYQDIDVYAKVSGYIQKLYVDYGTHVRQGQLMAVLEIPELEQQIQHDEASTAEAREELNRAQSAYAVAHVTYQRLAGVQKTRPELISQQDIDVAQGKDVEASAAVSAAQQSLLAAKAALEKDKTLYGYAQMTAPFDGVVTQMHAYKGALLPAGTSSNIGNSALCHLAQNNPLRLVIPVPERVVPDIRIGQTVSVNVLNLKRTFGGQIIRVSDQIDLATRAMHTEVQVPNPKYEIVPGMYASVELALQTAWNVLAVPVQALDRQKGQATVFVVDSDDKVQSRQVQTGIETPDEVEVVSGLKENDLVVVGDRSELRAGTTVQPKLISSSLPNGGM